MSRTEYTVAAAVDAERTLLGAILLDNSSFYDADQTLRCEEFSLDSHRRIYAGISRLMNRGSAADTTTISEELRDTHELDAIGGIGYIFSLTEDLPLHLSIASYVRLVKDKASLRDLHRLGMKLADVSAETGTTAEDLIERAESRLMEIRAGREKALGHSIENDMSPLITRMWEEKNRTTELLGLPSGVASLDLLTRGFQPGELTIIGARSGVGKTSLLVQSALANMKEGIPVLLFSLEMTKQQVLRRILSAVTGVPFPRVRDTRWATDADMQRMTQAAAQIATWPLHIVDASGISIDRIAATARLAIRRHGVKLVGVDYVQIVNASGKDERLRVSAISRGLTRLAKDEQVPVLALSQLSRPDRSSMNRRPAMSDLRESSQIENDAHCIVLAHREWDEDTGKLESGGELIVAKQRSGETGALQVNYDRRTLTFNPILQTPQHLARSTEGAA